MSKLIDSLDSLISEILIRETTKYGREGQIWTNQALTKGLSKKLSIQLIPIIKETCERAIGEDETPRQAEERARKLTLGSMELAEEAVRFHARNAVKFEQRSRLEKLINE